MAENAPYDEEEQIENEVHEELLDILLGAALASAALVSVSTFSQSDIDDVNSEYRRSASRIMPTLSSASQRAIEAGVNRAMRLPGVSGLTVDYTDEFIQNHIRAVLTSNMDQVTETNRATLRRVIEIGQEKGWSEQEIARRFKRYFGLVPNHVTSVVRMEEALIREGASKRVVRNQTQRKIDQLIEWRASLIADNIAVDIVEGSKANAFAYLLDTGQLSRDYVKQWVSVIDDRTSEICTSSHRTIAELDGRFNNGFNYPPAHGHCRSSIRIIKRPS